MKTIVLSIFEFVLLGLAVFRCMRLFVFDLVSIKLRQFFQVEEEHVLEDGSVEIIVSGRGKGLRYIIGEMLACHWCVGMWSTLGLYLGYTLAPIVFTPILYVLAIAGVAGIIQVMISK
ncbi:DUF1360 domain-containing protein [Paraliobacillus ryukyuensis]|uniref:DUF1360 domain-containing protein n=1 Tax=Paraliobacillus ryukyuensis TaxID=200904 RepID=UPI0021191A9B|nr:DUF1360 domain-containing protein [Paraliobacillus ryukyuensis]